MWSDWYVFGYCKQRQDFRLYKLRRLWDLQLSEGRYEVRVIPDEKLQFGTHMTDDYFVTAIFDVVKRRFSRFLIQGLDGTENVE